MSNEFAIAAVTLSLRNILDGVKEIKNDEDFDQIPEDARPQNEILISTMPLAQTPELDKSKNYVNLFLYGVEHNTALSNAPLQGRSKPGECGLPPLALNLNYIITAYGESGNELIGHLLLGKAMSLLHDHPLLSREEIKAAFPESELHNQIERIRITPKPVSLDDLSKLWSGFQTQFRLSASYEVSVVLIDSRRAVRAPLPVLKRGADDKGVQVSPRLASTFPILYRAEAPAERVGAHLGDAVSLTGENLTGDTITVRLAGTHLAEPRELAPLTGATSTRLEVVIPDESENIPPGWYRISIVVVEGVHERNTNEIPLAVLPEVPSISIAPSSPPAPGEHLVTVTCKPHVLPGQKVSLLLDDREFRAPEREASTDEVAFPVKELEAGEYHYRLRVDGVDSALVDRSASPPTFDPAMKITIP